MRYINSSFSMAGYLILFFLVLFSPRNSDAALLIYTIQTGSFINEATAGKHFDSLIETLKKDELEYLRIEKIGKYFTVRIGKYESRDKAEVFLNTITPRLPSAIIIDAYIKKDRIIKLYKDQLLSVAQQAHVKPLSHPLPEKAETRNDKKVIAKPLAGTLIYTIQTGSFADAADAGKQFESITKVLSRKELDNIRVEKIGDYYSVRLGKFNDRAEAEAHLNMLGSKITSAVILSAYIKEERIIKSLKGLSSGELKVKSGTFPGQAERKKDHHVSQERIKEKVRPELKEKTVRVVSSKEKPVKDATAEKAGVKAVEQIRTGSSRGGVSEGKKRTESQKPAKKTKPAKLIYAVQVGKHAELDHAQKQFDAIVKVMNPEALEHLRIEKTGNVFSIRIGKYDVYASAKKLLEYIKNHFSESVIIYDTYSDDERLIRLYSSSLPVKARVEKRTSLSVPSLEKEKEIMITGEGDKDEEEHNIAEGPLPEVKQGKVMLQVTAGPGKSVKTKDDNSMKRSAPVKTEKPVIETTEKKDHTDKQIVGDMYVRKGNNFLAIEKYRQIRDLDPVESRKFAELLYTAGFVDEAVAELQKAVEAFPDYDDLRARLGVFYLVKENPEKAKKQFFTALEMNPGNTYVCVYLGESFIKTGEYGKAWMFARMAQRLGYEGHDLIKKLSSLANKPKKDYWDNGQSELYVRQILVNDHEEARRIVQRISGGELFEDIARRESEGPKKNVGGYLGHISHSEVVPEVADALLDQDIFAGPIIVETNKGYHIVQLILPFDINSWREFVDGSG